MSAAVIFALSAVAFWNFSLYYWRVIAATTPRGASNSRA
jgi:hypothetical protein